MHNFYVGEGSDLTGVPTKMVTMNCSMRMTVYNEATFFGIHVSSAPVNIMFSKIAVATGQVRIPNIFSCVCFNHMAIIMLTRRRQHSEK